MMTSALRLAPLVGKAAEGFLRGELDGWLRNGPVRFRLLNKRELAPMPLGSS